MLASHSLLPATFLPDVLVLLSSLSFPHKMSRFALFVALMALVACVQGRTMLQDQTLTFSAPSQEAQTQQAQTQPTTTSSAPSSEATQTKPQQTVSFPAPSSEGGGQAQTISFPTPSAEAAQGQTSPQLQTQEKNVLGNVPSDIAVGGTTVDTGVVQDVNSSLQQNVNDPKSGSQALSSSLSSANAVSVSKGFSVAVANNPASATAFSNAFAQLCVTAAQSGNAAFATKSVASFSLSIVFLVVTGNVALAKTCASAFVSFVTTAGGCSDFVVVILQTFIQITVSLTTKTTVNIFG